MSRTVDSKIVEMRFDNKQFESNIRQTLSSLGKLKEALKLPESTKSLEGLSKATKDVKIDGIAAGVEALEKRFSTMGIVGMRVIENITDGLMNKVASAVNFVTNAIVSGGMKRAMNIENAHFQLQSLLKDEEKVQAVMANANDSVTGTAYAYDEAAKAASQFAASGVEAGEDMMRALKGITGVAAMTNSEYEGISRIFTTVAGQGRVMGDQLLQLSSRGLNAASTIAKWFREVQGQSKVTEAVVREMVTDGEISFQIFADAMGWAFGESAERANETFTGSFANMKSALARIGQGFFTPFIEQNSEMVKLFNALRIKINDVKSALVFDEQTSAISGLTKESDLLTESVSKFVKNGKTGLSEFTDAIIGAVMTEDELALANEALSSSYEKIKTAGYASAESFAEFSAQGINAGKAVRDYMNGILDGSIKATKGVKDSVSEITQGAKVMVGDIGKYAREGKISYDIFTDAIVWGSGVVEKETGMTSAVIKNMMAEVKESGSVTFDTLVEFNKNNMNAAHALREYMNGVEDGSIRANYAVTEAVHNITNGAKLGLGDITRLAEEGTITYEVFQAAMERTYGDQNKLLSRSFTETVLDQIKKITQAVNQMDMTKPMEAFYYSLESVKNVLKGLYSVAKPVGTAFAEVFLSFNPDRIVSFAAAIESLTSRMRLSEKGSKGLHDAMKGLFDVVKLVVDIFIKLISIVIPMGDPFADVTGGMVDSILGLAGAVGRSVSAFTDFVRSSTILQRTYQILGNGVRLLAGSFGYAANYAWNFLKEVYQLPEVQRIISKITSTFVDLGQTASRHIAELILKVEEFGKSVAAMIPEKALGLFESFKQAVRSVASELSKIDLSTPSKLFQSLSDTVNKFFSIFTNSGSAGSFIESAKKFGEGVREAFNFETTVDKLEKAKESFVGVVEWVQNTFGQLFSGFSIASAGAGLGGIGIIYAMIKAFKSFTSAVNPLSSLSGLIGGVKNTLVAYQHDLNASAIIKIAGAIAILAGALVVLSFVDTIKLFAATGALISLADALMVGAAALILASRQGNSMNTALNTFAKGVSSTMKKVGRALEIKALGSTVKKFAESIAIIAVTIIGLGLMYQKDPEAIKAGVDLVKDIGIALGALMGLGSILGSFTGKGMRNFATAALGILSLSLSLTLIVRTLNKLFKMEFPSDWEFKAKVLVAMLGGLGGLAMVLGLANRLAGKGTINAGSILALTIMLIATVASLDKLFKMEFPSDWQNRVIILGLIFAELGGLMIAVGVAGRLAGGSLKATGTILAMCAFLVTATAALMVLSIVPFEKLMSGATALGVVLMSLAVALVGAGKITNESAHKTVLSMAIAVGSITASLGFLSMIPLPQLAKAAGVLSAMLMVMAVDFIAISKITNEEAWSAVLAMAGAVAVIALSLHFLAEEPWEGLLAGSVALSAVLLSMGYVFKQIGELDNEIKIDAIGMFLLATTSLLPITLALYALSNQPWDGMLAAGAALSSVMVAYGLVFLAVTETKPDLTAIGLFLAGTLAIVPIAGALYVLSEQPWQNLLAAGASITAVLLSMAAVMVVCSSVGAAAGAAIAGMGVLALFIAGFTGLMVAMGAIFENDSAKQLLNGGIEMLIRIGEGIGEFVGAIVAGVITRISATLPQLGADLSAFMLNLTPFIIGSKMIDAGAVASVGLLAAIIVALTAAEIINGIASILGLSFVDMADELSDFMIALKPFIEHSKALDESSAKACGYIAAMVLSLTAADLLAGVTKFLGINGGMSQFGEELESFGPSIAKFAEDVKDVKPEAVQGAASAAEIMAEMSKKLPGTGGLAQKIFGTKSIAQFGTELESFGPHIAAFAETVKDVDPEAVKGAAAAAEIMSKLESELPAQGGLQAKIFGTKSISVFGEELVVFGPYVVEFADMVKDLNPESIKGVETITSIMSGLANDLPASDSLWDKIFGGGTTSLTDFGKELVNFGPQMKKFADSVSGISTTSLDSAVEAFKTLADLSDYVNGDKAQNIVEFSKGMEDIGTSGINSFIRAFNDGKSRVISTIKNFFSSITSTVSMETSKLNIEMSANAGHIVDGLNRGLQNGIGTVRRTAIEIAATIDQSFCKELDINSPSKIAEVRGEQFTEGLHRGMVRGKKEVIDIVTELAKKMDESVEKSDFISGKFNTDFHKSVSKLINAAQADLGELANIVDAKLITIGEGLTQFSLAISKNMETGLTNITYAGNGFKKFANELLTVSAEATKAIIEGDMAFQEKLTLSREALQLLRATMIQDENDYWRDLLAIKKAGADAEKYQTMELEDFQKEVLNEAKSVYEEYVKEFESTKDRIISSYDLFTEVTKKETKSKKELKKILESQIKAYEEYYETIQSLESRLDGTALLEYLKDLSVDSVDQLKVMNDMTDEELMAYAALYDNKLAAANEIAVWQMQDLKKQTEQELNDLFGTMYYNVNLDNFSSVFDGSIKSIQTYINEVVAPMEQFAKDIYETGIGIGTKVGEGVSDGMSGLGTAFSTAVENSLNAQGDVGKVQAEGIGTNLAAGVIGGMGKVEGMESEASKLINSIVDSLKVAGEIHSPSEKTSREIGQPLLDGIAQGMLVNLDPLSKSATDIVNKLIEFLETGIKSANEVGSKIVSAISEAISTNASAIESSGKALVGYLSTGIISGEEEAVGAVSQVGTSVITQFGTVFSETKFKDFGQNIITGIVSGLNNKKTSLITLIKNTCNDIIKECQNGLASNKFITFGQSVIQGLMTGFSNKKSSLFSEIRSLCNSINSEFTSGLPEKNFKKIGESIGNSIGKGITSNLNTIIGVCEVMCSQIISAVDDALPASDFEDIGSAAAQGLSDGIEEEIDNIADSAIRAARAAIRAAREELDENSPSRVFMEIGQFASKGLAIGIIDSIKTVDTAGRAMANGAITPVQLAMSKISSMVDEVPMEPVIKPVVDLSEIEEGFGKVSTMFSRTFDISATYDRALSASASFNSRRKEEREAKATKKEPVSNVFEFTQNNYSPKALSASEIYRQTRNQISVIKGRLSQA